MNSGHQCHSNVFKSFAVDDYWERNITKTKLLQLIHEFSCKKAREVLSYFNCLTWWEKLITFSYSRVNDSTIVYALHIYLFHLMLQSVLFRVMNTSIMGTPRDIRFYWKDRDLRKIVPQGPWKPHLALPYITAPY